MTTRQSEQTIYIIPYYEPVPKNALPKWKQSARERAQKWKRFRSYIETLQRDGVTREAGAHVTVVVVPLNPEDSDKAEAILRELTSSQQNTRNKLAADVTAFTARKTRVLEHEGA